MVAAAIMASAGDRLLNGSNEVGENPKATVAKSKGDFPGIAEGETVNTEAGMPNDVIDKGGPPHLAIETVRGESPNATTVITDEGNSAESTSGREKPHLMNGEWEIPKSTGDHRGSPRRGGKRVRSGMKAVIPKGSYEEDSKGTVYGMLCALSATHYLVDGTIGATPGQMFSSQFAFDTGARFK